MNAAYRNEVHIHGTLAKAPIIKYTPSGKCVANLTIITKYENFNEFHRVVAWEKLAEKVEKLTKGDFVKVVGRLQTRSWEDKQISQKRYITEVVAFQLVIPSQEQESASGGTAIARAILSPSPDTRNIHGVEEADSGLPF